MHDNKIIKVSSQSPVASTSNCLVRCFESTQFKDSVELRAIGASSINQLIKATAVTRGLMATKGYDLILRPSFSDDVIGGETKTVLVVSASLLRL